MNANLKIVDESVETRQKVYYVERINSKIPWPPNADLAIFVSKGKHKKYKVLEIGDNNIKVVMIK